MIYAPFIFDSDVSAGKTASHELHFRSCTHSLNNTDQNLCVIPIPLIDSLPASFT